MNDLSLRILTGFNELPEYFQLLEDNLTEEDKFLYREDMRWFVRAVNRHIQAGGFKLEDIENSQIKLLNMNDKLKKLFNFEFIKITGIKEDLNETCH